jgi:hypothetical protein
LTRAYRARYGAAGRSLVVNPPLLKCHASCVHELCQSSAAATRELKERRSEIGYPREAR